MTWEERFKTQCICTLLEDEERGEGEVIKHTTVYSDWMFVNIRDKEHLLKHKQFAVTKWGDFKKNRFEAELS